jgi:hypothetical protein
MLPRTVPSSRRLRQTHGHVVLCTDDVRKGYRGCYGDGDGPYTLTPGGANRTLPATLNTDGLTHEQCAQAAGQAGYDVFALQASGSCFMGTIADVVKMKRTLPDATCSGIPCVAGTACGGMVNKVYLISAPSQDSNKHGVRFNCPVVLERLRFGKTRKFEVLI